jgi:hypothetical protein
VKTAIPPTPEIFAVGIVDDEDSTCLGVVPEVTGERAAQRGTREGDYDEKHKKAIEDTVKHYMKKG